MSNFKISSVTKSDLTNHVDDVTVDLRYAEGSGDQEETIYTNPLFPQWYGYYKEIPEVKTAIDMRAVWTIGKGYESPDAQTRVILDHISGNGTDTFNSVLKNMMIIKRVNGDAYAEIVRDKKTGIIVNIKPLDPRSINVIFDKNGMIKRYEQVAKIGTKKAIVKFNKSDIFHLTHKRTADEIHGCSDIEAIEQIILANKESFVDMKKLMHRYVKPMMKFILDTDNQSEIDTLISKFDAAVNKGENLYIPKGTVEQELIAVPSNATLNPLPWREHLKNYFFQVVGIPQIILGSSGEFTESTAKIAYLAFEQSVDDEQNEIEAQVWNQLQLRIQLTFPASLRNEVLSDTAKDGADQQTGFQPSDTTAGVGR